MNNYRLNYRYLSLWFSESKKCISLDFERIERKQKCSASVHQRLVWCIKVKPAASIDFCLGLKYYETRIFLPLKKVYITKYYNKLKQSRKDSMSKKECPN